MPTLKDELCINENSTVKLLIEKENNEKTKSSQKNIKNELSCSLKKMENILMNLFDEINFKNNLSTYNTDDLSITLNLDKNNENKYEEIIKMSILDGMNRYLKDNLNLSLNVILKIFQELLIIEKRMDELTDENDELRSLNIELNSNVEYLKCEINQLNCEKYHLEQQLKEKNISCIKYKSSLNKSIKTMQKLYLENDNFTKEINLLENQLVISKLRVAQYNEELEHIRTLLKYYKNQVSSDYILSPAIEQMVKVEPCRVSMKNKQLDGDKKKIDLFNNNVINNKMPTNIGNILSKLLFNNGSNTTNNLRKNKKYSFIDNKVNTSTSPIFSYFSDLSFDNKENNDKNLNINIDDFTKNINSINNHKYSEISNNFNSSNQEVITPIKSIEKCEESLSTNIENKSDNINCVYNDECLFTDESILSPLSSNLLIENNENINQLDIH